MNAKKRKKVHISTAKSVILRNFRCLMFNIQPKEVHIGKAILERLQKLRMTKTEFGKRIGRHQQHVNKIFEKESIDTKLLLKICYALEFNFFELYCEFPAHVEANLSAVALGNGDAHNTIGESAILTQLELYKTKCENAEHNEVQLLKQIELLERNVSAKDEIINLLKNK